MSSPPSSRGGRASAAASPRRGQAEAAGRRAGPRGRGRHRRRRAARAADRRPPARRRRGRGRRGPRRGPVRGRGRTDHGALRARRRKAGATRPPTPQGDSTDATLRRRTSSIASRTLRAVPRGRHPASAVVHRVSRHRYARPRKPAPGVAPGLRRGSHASPPRHAPRSSSSSLPSASWRWSLAGPAARRPRRRRPPRLAALSAPPSGTRRPAQPAVAARVLGRLPEQDGRLRAARALRARRHARARVGRLLGGGRRTAARRLRCATAWRATTGRPSTRPTCRDHLLRWRGNPGNRWLGSTDRLDRVEVTGPSEVTVTLTSPWCFLEECAIVNPSHVVPAGAYDHEGTFRKTVGTGPYAVEEIGGHAARWCSRRTTLVAGPARPRARRAACGSRRAARDPRPRRVGARRRDRPRRRRGGARRAAGGARGPRGRRARAGARGSGVGTTLLLFDTRGARSRTASYVAASPRRSTGTPSCARASSATPTRPRRCSAAASPAGPRRAPRPCRPPRPRPAPRAAARARAAAGRVRARCVARPRWSRRSSARSAWTSGRGRADAADFLRACPRAGPTWRCVRRTARRTTRS